MNRSAFVSLMAGACLSLLGACSKQDQVISVDGNDPDMNAAIAKARETLPQFWQVFEKRDHGENEFSLKVKITDAKGSEHFWVSQLDRRDGKTTGIVNNEPDSVRSVKLGQRIEIPQADISDWLYMRNGRMVGNRTLVPLFKTMPKEEAERYKQMMADP